MAIRGYARVSTADQDLAAQLDALTAAGAEVIYQEKISGANKNRPELLFLMAALQPGDVLLVTRLDRLARSTLDLLTILKTIGDAGVLFKSLADQWCDTTTPHGRLMLTVLGGLAEFERELIKARTGEGRKRAMAAGVKFGRKDKLSPLQQLQAAQRLKAGESLNRIAKDMDCDRKTVKRCKLLLQAAE